MSQYIELPYMQMNGEYLSPLPVDEFRTPTGSTAVDFNRAGEKSTTPANRFLLRDATSSQSPLSTTNSASS